MGCVEWRRRCSSENHYRPDYSSYHVLDYDLQSGGVSRKVTHQGYANESAWARGQVLSVHGWVYSLHDGRVRELGMDVASPDALEGVYARAVAGVRERRGTGA